MWYTIHNVDLIDSPALLVYPDRVRDNIQLLKSRIDDVHRLRPHVKTAKIAEVVQLMQEAGIQKFKCATIAEAEMLGQVNAADVLLAYQPVGPKITRLAALVEAYPQTAFSCLVDNEQAAAAIAAHFAVQQRPLPIWLDLNIGQNRTGIMPGPAALDLYAALHDMRGITPAGLHAYDGHLHDEDLEERTRKSNAAFEAVTALAGAIADKGLPAPRIIAGGTPTFPVHARRKGIECSPGTFVFWDWGYQQHLPDQTFHHAALVLARVISQPGPGLLCLDLGHKSVAAENPLPRRVHFLNAPDAEPVSQSEEHLVLRVKDTADFPVGTVLYGVPYHICPTVALYDKAYTITGNTCTGEWNVIARKRNIII
ncbi:D-TA family PLP-dependent enzyme [Chitinophaga japonensis]|uniref:D-serine deaminase-like pyridoxal phosphate-dependent protein n=1 Tax=Chitinophaga japonensis TaxID=104662 RepID=A0A562TB56_CHIJA|nr:D-TA family PLP-dependent enzyme [Chitinophaga japonensis]TWI90805.1 D-serine deaminase-like pyridoxal phosphate-dependent protein [Chitinophaga japonensis]